MPPPALVWRGTLSPLLLAVGLRVQPAPTPASSTPLEDYRLVGPGGCLSSAGEHWAAQGTNWRPSWLRPDRSSLECERACGSDPKCAGYVTSGRWRCSVIAAANFSPSDADGNEQERCFLRHAFKYSSGDYKPSEVPAIIWSFWHGPASRKVPVNPHDLISWAKYKFEHMFNTSACEAEGDDPLVALAVESWRKLNPDYEIRMLNLDSFQKWLSPEDLPRTFDRLQMAHKADAIRIAALAKYGGVWIDASAMMLRPLSAVLGQDRMRRAFVATSRGDLTRHDKRVDWTYYVENAFLTAPVNDTLISQVKSCFLEAFSELAAAFTPRPLGSLGLFSREQLEEMEGLGIKDSYLTMHACFFKSLDEDAGMKRFWDGPWSKRIEGSRGLFPHLYLYGEEAWDDVLFRQHRPDLLDRLLDPDDGSFLLKFREVDRRRLNCASEQDLRCRQSTFSELLRRLGLNTTCVSS